MAGETGEPMHHDHDPATTWRLFLSSNETNDRRLRKLIDTLPVGLAIFRERETGPVCTAVNASFERLTGRSITVLADRGFEPYPAEVRRAWTRLIACLSGEARSRDTTVGDTGSVDSRTADTPPCHSDDRFTLVENRPARYISMAFRIDSQTVGITLTPVEERSI